MPALPISMAKGLHKSPKFNTVVQKVSAGKGNASIGLMEVPTWNFEFDLDSVQGNEAQAASTLAAFLGVFIACNGQNGLWLFTDPQDSSVAYANSAMFDVTAGSTTPMAATGNGASKQFQLGRYFGGIVGAEDIIQNVTGTPVIKVNGATLTAGTQYSISATGVVTFVTAPANGAVLTWSGSFQYLCRFDEDTVDATRVFTTNSGTDLWDLNSIKFSSELV
jgi:uncharacterized protein (TIGR02217 family)